MEAKIRYFSSSEFEFDKSHEHDVTAEAKQNQEIQPTK
jgi:hypothetical protein